MNKKRIFKILDFVSEASELLVGIDSDSISSQDTENRINKTEKLLDKIQILICFPKVD